MRAAQPTLSNLPELHSVDGFALSAFKGIFKKDSEKKICMHTYVHIDVDEYIYTVFNSAYWIRWNTFSFVKFPKYPVLSSSYSHTCKRKEK